MSRPFPGRELKVGRDLSNTIAIANDPLVSRFHLLMQISDQGVFCTDLGSQNGTFINGSRIAEIGLLLNSPFELSFGSQKWMVEPRIVRMATVEPKSVQTPGVQQFKTILFNKGDGRETCRRCAAKLSVLEQLAKSSRFGLCRECAKFFDDSFGRFQRALQGLVASKVETSLERLEELMQLATRLGLPFEEAVKLCPLESVQLFRKFFYVFQNDGFISDEEEQILRFIEKEFQIPRQDAEHVWTEISTSRQVVEISSGTLVPVKSSMQLQSDEACFHQSRSAFLRQMARGTRVEQGELVVTSKRIVFLSPGSGFEVGLSKVGRAIAVDSTLMSLELTRKQGSGLYQIESPRIVCAKIEHLTKRLNRTVNIAQAGSRSIPQDVKSAVFVRDGGRCVECNSNSYLEFDHIIPFSLGGATSIDNLQLLCRSCNLKKSNKI